MLQEYWQEQLHQTMENLRANKRQPRIAVIGIGHELRGDDAAGVILAHRLNGLGCQPSVLIAAAGAAPENYCGLICRHRPDLVLFADAADMAAEPGTIRWLPWQSVTGFNLSTHAIPLQLLSVYLTSRLEGCQVGLLGIQPADLSLDMPLSAAVDRAVWVAVQGLAKLLMTPEGAAIR